MNKKLIKRLREWCPPDEPPIDEAADALEKADARYDKNEIKWMNIASGQLKRIEQLEADNAVHDTEADNAKEWTDE